ncbi:MAG: bifunctional diaminohydroxyphosphoribosylaminopyrimidine deaminase/5-amino-6-(5-phosphoribosylamino)uracil reductase RibD [Muribaculaceae bacterium]|nr:bifunctional diaminohydroxyphosphoribosylaminopyrimidine deaminase/5-amino-6-(5-phosphoribosylamino)uracil reductase RibD [Muribaculaceae bacterium]
MPDVTALDEKMMRRAIQLARNGRMDTSPNPMVGCVIAIGDRIIGEGYHRRCGEGHAEVNAVASVADPSMLKEATAYVTLEPCSHYGKTPPCARLLIDKGLKRVVIGSGDPNAKVNGRGVAMLREAGIEVVTGVLEDECRAINPHFMTAFSADRPYVMLKWAQSADGYMDVKRDLGEPSFLFSTPLNRAIVHRLRATHDAIMVGRRTADMDRPSLTVRYWAGRNPRRIIADSHESVSDMLLRLRAEGVTSLLVEGGPALLRSFIECGMWDEARIEVAPVKLGDRGTAQAPVIPMLPADMTCIDGNKVLKYKQ